MRRQLQCRSYASYVVGASPKGVLSTQSFAHRERVESHVQSLPRFKKGSVEVVGVGKDLVAVVGLSGAEKKNEVREAAADATRALRRAGASGEVLVEGLGDEEAAIEGAVLGAHAWSMKTKEDDQPQPMEVRLASGADFGEAVRVAQAELEGRVLCSLPANVVNPASFCDKIREAAKGLPIEFRVYEEAEMEELGLQGILVVGKGSHQKSKMLEMVYRGREGGGIDVGLVGKGVTFDSGGISIKPSSGMGDMKADMSGGAAVAMATIAVARNGLKANVATLVPLVENMPSGTATRPGDVYKALNGLTVEVDNTDAEGRLILGDALTHMARTHKPDTMVDVATLTGAIHVALGDRLTGCFTNSDQLWELLRKAGEETGQGIWRMPLMPHFLEPMKSDVADLINSGSGRGGGSCTAAAFLEQFVEKHGKWAHLDIAGTMQAKAPKGVLAKGMTGGPTRSLYYLVKHTAQAASKT